MRLVPWSQCCTWSCGNAWS